MREILVDCPIGLQCNYKLRQSFIYSFALVIQLRSAAAQKELADDCTLRRALQQNGGMNIIIDFTRHASIFRLSTQLNSTQLWICVHPRWVKSLCENSFVQIIIRHLTFIVSKIGIGIFAGLLKVDAIKKCNGSSYLLRTGMVTMEESKKR